MARTVRTLVSQKLELNPVRDVIVSDAAQDSETGNWYRSIKFVGEPDSGVAGNVVLEVVIASDVKAELNLTTPVLDF